jgi:hypothetical protein
MATFIRVDFSEFILLATELAKGEILLGLGHLLDSSVPLSGKRKEILFLIRFRMVFLLLNDLFNLDSGITVGSKVRGLCAFSLSIDQYIKRISSFPP